MALVKAGAKHLKPESVPASAWGVFSMRMKDAPGDLHFHDCDEYWLITGGKARVRSGDEEAILERGDLVFTEMGAQHHTVEILVEPFEGVYLETTLRGRKRTGHLHVPDDPLPTPEEIAG